MSGISTHILDTAIGQPATGVPVTLSRKNEDASWQVLSTVITDADGRCKQLLPEDVVLVAGDYRIRFETNSYYDARALKGLYPYVEITFTVREGDTHLHVPLLLTANGYTTYRGS